AIADFMIPYMLVFHSELLMIETTFAVVRWNLFTAMVGMMAIGAGLIGFWYRNMHWVQRFISVITGLLLILPEGNSDWFGLGIFVVLLIFQFSYKRERRKEQEVEDG